MSERVGKIEARGVGPETLAGLLLENPMDRVAGMLGILRAGGAYLALDPSWPRRRERTELGLQPGCSPK